MTTAMLAPFRADAFQDCERTTDGFMAKAAARFAAYLDYRRTLDELRALTARQRADMGFAGSDVKSVARAAAYGA